MSTQPVEDLELRAIEQRAQLHQSAAELKGKLATARQKLNLTAQVHQHFTPIAAAISLLALLAGYGAGGMIPRR